MQVRRLGGLAVVGLLACPAWAQWESGSDGSDGAYSPAISTQVDLSLAASLCDCDQGGVLNDPCRWDCPSPVAGRGVYDAQQWVVVFKYTTVNVPSGVTITFGMHPSGAPVAWLATGDVTINGRVDLDGEDAVPGNPPIIPYYTRPGPGGFEGAQAGHSGAVAGSFGLGPGSSPTNPSNVGAAASHASVGGGCTGGTGLIYGNSSGMPLLGGSGGNVDPEEIEASGGAGGGAILIAAPVQVTLGAVGSVTAQGGSFFFINCNAPIRAGSGSGGTIRMRAATVSLAAGSQIIGKGGDGCGGACGSANGGDGWVRIEASTVMNNGTINGNQSFPGAPSVVFPAAPPQLYVTAVCGQSAPADPMWGIKTADIDLNTASACTVNIAGTGMPVGSIIVVRAIPARGNVISVNSTPMVDAGGGLRTATASVTFPAGRAELQLRANW